jgi:Ser/Thr protein kinase RdoA (MazF antagonist)
MLKEVAEVYTDAVLDQAADLYNLTRADLILINSNTDVVHSYIQRGIPCILKLIHSSQASRALVQGEVDWVEYLADNGVPVSRPVPSKKGSLVEVVELESSYFSVVAYQKALGVHVGYEEDVHNAALFSTCGRVVGRMHALAKTYVPTHPDCKRPDWRTLRLRERFPPELAHVSARRDQLVAHLDTLPIARDDYGIIHCDFHAYNFMVHLGGITVFDFAECCYSWFVYDLAIVLYHVLDLPYLGDDYEGFGGFFMQHFMPAYCQENHLDRAWESEMDAFLRLREISIYAYIYCNWDYAAYPGDARWMEAARHRIENGLPIVRLDYNFNA